MQRNPQTRDDEILSDLKRSIETSHEALKRDLSKMRTGRAHAGMLDSIRVDYYGTPTPLNQCANLAVADARLMTVRPFDRNLVSDIEKAIMAADVGITPQSDGEIIRLPVPPLTEERRRDLVKHAKRRGEEARVALRTHRRDANDMLKDLEKDKEISQDDLKKGLEKVQSETGRGIERVDEILAGKEKEILEI